MVVQVVASVAAVAVAGNLELQTFIWGVEVALIVDRGSPAEGFHFKEQSPGLRPSPLTKLHAKKQSRKEGAKGLIMRLSRVKSTSY